MSLAVMGSIPTGGATPPDITNSDLFMVHYWTGFFGSDHAGGWGRKDELSIESSTIEFAATTYTATHDDNRVSRDVSDTENDYSDGDDQDTRFENVLNVTAPSTSTPDSGSFTVDDYGRVVFAGGGDGYTGPDGMTAVRYEQESDTETENLAIGFGVRKPSGLTTGSINGTFVFITFQHGFAGGPNPPTSWGNTEFINVTHSEFTFDGSGNFSEDYSTGGFSRTHQEIFSDIGSVADHDTINSTRVSTSQTASESSTDSGTYSVGGSGTIILNYTGGDSGSAQIGADGNTAVMGLRDFSDNSHGVVVFGFGVRKGSAMTNADVAGSYTMIDLDHEWSGSGASWGEVDQIELGRTYATLDADGTLDIRRDQWEISRSLANEEVDNNPGEPGDDDRVHKNRFTTSASTTSHLLASGTYTLDPSGGMTISIATGDDTTVLTGQVSADGKTLIFGGTRFDADIKSAEALLGVGIRRTPPSPGHLGIHTAGVGDGLKADGFHMTLQADAGTPVEVLVSDDLGGWQLLQAVTPSTLETPVVDGDAVGMEHRFYLPVLAPW